MGKGILSGGNSSLAATNSKISSHNEDPSAHPQLVSTLEDYVDNKISEIPAPDISGEISQHNSDITAHADIREELSNVESAVSTAQTTANSAQAAAVNAQEVAASKANASHTHTKSQITDFPTSMTPTAHNHAAGDITSGTLPVARGGTGVTSNPSMLVNLASTSAASVFATSPRPGVTGILPVANGGTGTNSLASLKSSLGVTVFGLQSKQIFSITYNTNNTNSQFSYSAAPFSRGAFLVLKIVSNSASTSNQTVKSSLTLSLGGSDNTSKFSILSIDGSATITSGQVFYNTAFITPKLSNKSGGCGADICTFSSSYSYKFLDAGGTAYFSRSAYSSETTYPTFTITGTLYYYE